MAIAMVALATTLATATTAVQIVLAQADDSGGGTSTDQPTRCVFLK